MSAPASHATSDELAALRAEREALRERVTLLERQLGEVRGRWEVSQASLRESQDLFAKTFNGSPVLMTLAQLPDGRLVEVNDAFERAVGLPKARLLGRSPLELGLWRDASQWDAFHARFREARQVRNFEVEFQNAAGDLRTLLLNAELVELGGSACILGIAIDVSERRRREVVEAALARAEESYRSIFENALEGLYQSSPDGRFLRANPALARMFGYASPEDLITSVNDIGRTVYVDPGRRGDFFRLLGQHDSVTDFDSEIFRRDGERMWISESVRAVRDAEGRLLHLEGIAIDITAQREQAQALAEAKEAADAANRAKSQFLASMSHELRTPLNGILGYTQILSRDATLGTAQQRGVEVIHQSAEHLLGLINDVLDLSKVEAGRLEFHPAPADLPALLTGVAELLGPRANAQGIGFATAFAPDLPGTVMMDEHRVRQVLLNLLSNAVKFTREGSVLFSAQSAPGEQPDTVRVTFSVSDTGAGIAEQDLPRLFQPFVRVGPSVRRADGTGLGLAISRSLVAAMGGQLQVESRPGWGSRFWFELTLSVVSHGSAAPILASRQVIGYDGERMHLLVVDDHPANREVLTGLLTSVGFKVEAVDSGEEALNVCAQRRPDLVLMDLRMEGMSGLDAARALRAAYGKSLRIVAVSASAYDLDRRACFDAGCDDFLPKPVQAEVMWQSLGRLLPISWRFEETAPTRPTIAPFGNVTQAPPAEFVRVIHDLARAGDIVGLRTQAEGLAAKHPEHAEFARVVLELAGNFKLKAIRQLVAPWIEGEKAPAAT